MNSALGLAAPRVRASVILSIAGALAGLPGFVSGQTFSLSRLLTKGDVVDTFATANSFSKVAVNDSGAWLVDVDLDYDTAQDGAIVRSGAILLREGQTLAGLLAGELSTVDGFCLNSAGAFGGNYFLRNTFGNSDDSGIFVNDTLLLQEGSTSDSPAFSPGTVYIGFFDARLNDNNQIFVIASVDDLNIDSSVDRAMVRLDFDPNTGDFTEVVYSKEGDIPPGQSETVTDFGTGPHQYGINNAGTVVYFTDLAGDSAVDGVFYMNDSTILAQEGGASPDPSRTYTSLSSKPIHLNDSGDVAFRATLSGDTASNEVIVKKPFGQGGAIVAQEGQVLASLAPYAIAGFGTGPVYITNDGDVVWVADTDNPDTSGDIALMFNETVVLREGQVIDGYSVQTIRSIENGYSVSPNGNHLIVRVVLTDGFTNFESVIAADVDPACLSDFNGDDFVDAIDYDQFIAAWVNLLPSADINNDDFVDAIDYDVFIAAWVTGC